MPGNQVIPRLVARREIRRADEVCEFDWEPLSQTASAVGRTSTNLPRDRVVGERLAADSPTPALRARMNIVIAGHVDHGKSTVIGRLLADIGSLPTGKVEAVRAMCERPHARSNTRFSSMRRRTSRPETSPSTPRGCFSRAHCATTSFSMHPAKSNS